MHRRHVRIEQNGITGEELRSAMWNVTIGGLRARKVRLLLTGLAVLLGVSFVSGVFVFTDTLRASFDSVFRSTALDVNLVVRSGGIGSGDRAQRERMDDDVVSLVRDVAGVEAADGVVQGIAKIRGRDGDVVQNGLAPTVGLSWPTAEGVGPLRLVDDGVSRAPMDPGEVAIDATTATDNGFAVGDVVGIQIGARPVEPYTVVGLFGFGDVTNLAGVTFAAFELSVAQEGFDAVGLVDTVNVRTAQDVPTTEVQRRILSTVGFGMEVVDAEVAAEELGEPLQQGLGFLERILLGFAAVGVFVGAFIIFNTFSILVSQRTRELGLLRSLGATNRQVVVAVLAEAAVIGIVAAGLGVVFGIALVNVLLASFPDLGFEIPDGPTIVRARTVVVAALVGIGVTTGSAIAPAIRAARLAPVVAVGHEARALTVPSLARRSAVGGLLLVAGAALITFGLRSASSSIESQVGAVAIGCFIVFLGVVLVSPAISRMVLPALATSTTAVLAATIGGIVGLVAVVRAVQLALDARMVEAAVFVLVALAGVALTTALPTMRGVLGVLAQGNAARNPRRTTATASALILGLTLVCLVAIVASSIRLSLQSGIEEGIEADIVLSADQFAPISTTAVTTAAGLPTVERHAEVSFGYAAVVNRTELVAGMNPGAFDGVVDLDVVEGEISDVREGILVNSIDAQRLGVRVGDSVTVVFSSLGRIGLPVTGIYENRGFTGSVLVDFIVSDELFAAAFGESQPATMAFLRAAPGTTDTTRDEIEQLLAETYPDVRVQTVQQFQAEQDRSIDLVVNVLLALLAFSLVIAVLGIVNTLFLSVYERTRELGLLRTVGATPVQIRRMIRGEAIVIAVIGCLFGAAVGLLWGWAFAASLHDEGVSRLSLPFRQLVVFVALAAAAGVVASIGPAWRASHLDVLEAVAEE